MQKIIRLELPGGTPRSDVEHDIGLAIFSAECVYGGPRTRLEVRYLINIDGTRVVLQVRGEAGEAAVRVLIGLCNERFGEATFRVERVTRDGDA